MKIKNKEVIFFLMEHNFIDQITPLIELLHTNNYKVKLIKCVHNYDYDTDSSLIYLLKKYPKLYIKDLYLNKNIVYKILHKAYNFFNFKQSIQTFFLLKGLYYILTTITRRVMTKLIDIKDKDIDTLLSDSSKNVIAIMDFTNSDFIYKKLRIHLNNRNITNYAFEHAFNIITNNLTTYSHLEYKRKEKIDSKEKFSDKLIVYNSRAIEYISQLYTCEKVQLPSLRYTSQWINNLQMNKNQFRFQDEHRYKLKVVFMMTHVDYNVWKEELFRTVQMVLTNPEICLVIKVHPRSIKEKNKFLKIKAPNFKVVANEVSSSALIEWSDIVMNISSGIIMEAIIKRKTIFYMKYLHCNSITPEETKNIIHIINTRDQLTFLLDLYKENKQQNFIDENEVREFLKDYIGNDDYEENCQQYLALLEKL